MQKTFWLINHYFLCVLFLILGILNVFFNYLFIVSFFLIIFFYKKKFNSIILLAYILGLVLATRHKFIEKTIDIIANRNSIIAAEIKNITKNNAYKIDLQQIKINEKINSRFIPNFLYTKDQKLKIGNWIKFSINKKFKFWQNYVFIQNDKQTESFYSKFNKHKINFDNNISQETKKVCDAIFWGYSTKSQLTEMYCLDKLGCQHLMARSGLHLVPINAIFSLSKSKINLILTILTLIGYMLTSSASYSFLRAILIALIIYFCRLIGLKANRELIFCQSLIIIIILWPESIFTASFQLSFTLVAALYFLTKKHK